MEMCKQREETMAKNGREVLADMLVVDSTLYRYFTLESKNAFCYVYTGLEVNINLLKYVMIAGI